MRSYHTTGLTLALMLSVGVVLYAIGYDDWLIFMAPSPAIAIMTMGLYREERSA